LICPKCKGTKHIRGPKGWRRCECVQAELSRHYVKPQLRRNSEKPQVSSGFQPYPLDNVLVSTDFETFRNESWASLLAHNEPIYDFIDSSRLVEIYLSQDPVYTRIRDLEELPILILGLGVAELPNKMLPHLISQVLTFRFYISMPTWVFTDLLAWHIQDKYPILNNFLVRGIHPSKMTNPPSLSAPAQRLDPRDL
jgi:hypothetical protein